MGVITISREFGSGGETVARLVAAKTGFLLVNKKTIAEGLAAFGIVEPECGPDERVTPATEEQRHRLYLEALHEYIYDLAIRNNLVILGRGGHVLFEDYPPSLHVRVISPFTRRVEQVKKMYNLGLETALRLVKEQDFNKRQYYRRVFGVNWSNLRGYDLVLNTTAITPEDAAEIIVASYRLHAEPRHISGSDEVTDSDEDTAAGQVAGDEEKFMHPSEAEFARMLDFYRIRWEYEPKTFLLEWDSEGGVTEAFAPDFYLPEQDIFIELTTQKPRLAWKKNRKIRRLKELYPEVKIKMINRHGFESLLRKHNSDHLPGGGITTGEGE
ncbi:MAG: cytidylate kinase family protein [Bacillota bacterium]